MCNRVMILVSALVAGCATAPRAAEHAPAATPPPTPSVLSTVAPQPPTPSSPPRAACDTLRPLSQFAHAEIGPITLYRDRDTRTRAIAFASQMAVNTDGAPDSYHPDDIGITHICNGVSVGNSCTWKADCLPDFRRARSEGFQGPTKICFFAMVTDSGGVPLIQSADDPKPGYFVSTTSLRQPGVPADKPGAYLDSNQIPFVVIPTTWQQQAFEGIGLGDFAAVWRKSTGKLSYAIVGDLGPKRKLGEGSVALHQALGNDPFQLRNGVRRARKGIGGRDVVYVLFPGSRKPGQSITREAIDRDGKRILDELGGEEYLRTCGPRM